MQCNVSFIAVSKAPGFFPGFFFCYCPLEGTLGVF